MPWYRTGTVAVTLNSTTVTGTGTNFAQNSRVGDAFQGPDGKWYEITNIASATVLSILPAYTSATATGGVYALAPMQGYVKESADQLRAITNQFGTTLGLLGTPTDTAGLRSNIGAAKSGANNDITSISGLTTALSVAQGGTGSATQLGARTNLGAMALGDSGIGGYMGTNVISSTQINTAMSSGNYYVSASVIGSLPVQSSGYLEVISHSQLYILQRYTTIDLSSVWTRRMVNGTWSLWMNIYTSKTIIGPVGMYQGAPSGAIIELGGNTNGSYTKFADGTLICFTSGLQAPTGINSVTWTFPASFVTPPPYVNLTLEPGETYDVRNYVAASQYLGTSTTQTKFTTYCASAVGSKSFAIGRWAA